MSELNDAHRSPLVTGDKTLGDVTRDICAPMDARPSGLWWAAFFVSFVALLVGAAAVWYQIATGIGTWGLNKTIGWGFDMTTVGGDSRFLAAAAGAAVAGFRKLTDTAAGSTEKGAY